MEKAPTLVISGSVGAGKTVVAAEVSAILARRGVAHAMIDMDGLAAAYPRPEDDPHGSRLALANLRDVWRNAAAAGARNIVLARVIESTADLEAIRIAVGSGPLVVCRLRADPATLQERVGRREVGSELAWHLDRAVELASNLDRSGPADHVIEVCGRSVPEIAAEVEQRVEWAE